ncbi:hypothetical protein A9W99_21340 [Mycobacterium sp. 1164966.3]|nr:hypothetical protein A9W99_21340 [Mycobacterium sp. 1164966.3]
MYLVRPDLQLAFAAGGADVRCELTRVFLQHFSAARLDQRRGKRRAAGGKCELQIWPHQVHVFQALPRMTPEAAKAMAYVARFIAHAMQDARVLAAQQVG